MDHYIIKIYPVNVDIDYGVQVAWKHGIELKEVKEAIEDEEKVICDCYEAEKSIENGEYEFYLGIVNKESIPQISELADTELNGRLVFIINYYFFSETEPFYKGIAKEHIEKPYRKLLKELKVEFHNELFTYSKLGAETSEKEISRIAKALENDVAGENIVEALANKESTIKWRCEKCKTEQTSKFLWEDIESTDGVKMYGSTPLKCENEKCNNVRLLVSYHSNIHNLMNKMRRR